MDNFFKFIEGTDLRLIGLWSNSFDSLTNTILSRNEFREAQSIYLSNRSANFDTLRSRLERLVTLNENSPDRDPYDTALAAYLLFIFKTDPNRSKELLDLFRANRMSNLWWTRYAINLITKAASSQTTSIETINVGTSNFSTISSSSLINTNYSNQLANSTQRINL